MKLFEKTRVAYFLYYAVRLCYSIVGAVAILFTIIFFASSDSKNMSINLNLQIQADSAQLTHIESEFQNHDVQHWTGTLTVPINMGEEDPAIIIPIFLNNISKMIILFVILFLLSNILKTVADGVPFEANNAKYLFIIGGLLLLQPLISSLLGVFQQMYINQLVIAEGVSILPPETNAGYYIASGLFVITLGYVFQEGTRLFEEHKLTV